LFRLAPAREKSGVVPPRFFAAVKFFVGRSVCFRFCFNRYKEEGTLLWHKPKIRLKAKEKQKFIPNLRQEGEPSNLVLSYIFSCDARKNHANPANFALFLRYFALFAAV